MLAICASDHPFDWEKRIRKVCMAYNISVQSSTGYTPCHLMFGWQARLPLDIMYGTEHHAAQSPSEYANTTEGKTNNSICFSERMIGNK